MKLTIITDDNELIDSIEHVEGYLNNTISRQVLIGEIEEIVARGILYEKIGENPGNTGGKGK